jgi:hypothetical protein
MLGTVSRRAPVSVISVLTSFRLPCCFLIMPIAVLQSILASTSSLTFSFVRSRNVTASAGSTRKKTLPAAYYWLFKLGYLPRSLNTTNIYILKRYPFATVGLGKSCLDGKHMLTSLLQSDHVTIGVWWKSKKTASRPQLYSIHALTINILLFRWLVQ